jgi:hypothetical protein
MKKLSYLFFVIMLCSSTLCAMEKEDNTPIIQVKQVSRLVYCAQLSSTMVVGFAAYLAGWLLHEHLNRL